MAQWISIPMSFVAGDIHTHTHARRRKFQASTNYGITFQVERSKICHESRIRLESRVGLKFSMTQMLSSFSVCRRHCHQRLVITQCSFSTRRRAAFVTRHVHSLRLRASQSIWFLRKVQDFQPPPSHALFLQLAHFIRRWNHFDKTPCSVQRVIASNRTRRRIDRWRTFIIKTYYSI